MAIRNMGIEVEVRIALNLISFVQKLSQLMCCVKISLKASKDFSKIADASSLRSIFYYFRKNRLNNSRFLIHPAHGKVLM